MTTSDGTPETRLVRCPRCRKSTRYDPKNAFRPFCSPLCKDEDIVAWAEGNYRIPGKPVGQGSSADGADEPEDDES